MNKRTISFSPPDITQAEIDLVTEVLRSGWITTGPKTKLFEQRIAARIGTPRVVCLSSASASLEAAMRMLGIGPGDEVITSAYTYTATCSAICHTGATPVLVDTQKEAYEMDYTALAAAITPKTKAVIPVDLAGVMCDYDRVREAVESKRALFTPSNPLQQLIGRVAIIDDAAHAFGATWHGQPCGRQADFTAFSFHAVKNLTTAEGGTLTWTINCDHDDLYRTLMLYSLHGQSKDALAKSRGGAWEYDVIEPAYKCNMTDIAAAMGLAQLDRYDATLNRRHYMIQRYNEAFRDYNLQVLNHAGTDHRSSGHLYMVRLLGHDEAFRNHIIAEMAECGIATNVHFKPLPMFTAYKRMGFDIANYPNAYHQYHNEITLPLHTLLSDDDQQYIIDHFIHLLQTQ